MRYSRSIPAFLLLATLALTGGTAAARTTATARDLGHHNAAAGKLTLTVKITTTGKTVWGWVWASWQSPQTGVSTKKKCSTSRCVWLVPAGVIVHLTQRAKDSSTWPFSTWKILGGGTTRHVTTTSFGLTMTHSYTVTATYVLT